MLAGCVVLCVRVCSVPVDILRWCSGHVPVKQEQPEGMLSTSPGRPCTQDGATEHGLFRNPGGVTQEDAGESHSLLNTDSHAQFVCAVPLAEHLKLQGQWVQ